MAEAFGFSLLHVNMSISVSFSSLCLGSHIGGALGVDSNIPRRHSLFLMPASSLWRLWAHPESSNLYDCFITMPHFRKTKQLNSISWFTVQNCRIWFFKCPFDCALRIGVGRERKKARVLEISRESIYGYLFNNNLEQLYDCQLYFSKEQIS